MAELAIKGHPTRGKEVIEILEMLGGTNHFKLEGEKEDFYYYIFNKNNYIYKTKSLVNNKYFLLEEFEKIFPYKIEDRVTYTYNHLLETQAIINMRWDSNSNRVLYYLEDCNVIDVEEILYKIECPEDNIPTIQDKSTVETMKEDKNNKSEDISYKANEQTCDTYNKIKNSKFRNDRIFQMALALAPTFAKAGLDLQQRLINNGCDVSSCTVGDKDILHAYGESLKLWATAFVDELNNNTK